MKKVIKYAFLLAFLCSCFYSCKKVWEQEWTERRPRPQVEIDTLRIPEWDFKDSVNK